MRSSEQIKKAFGQRLTALREAKGLSQTECARQLGITDKTKYNKWENGISCPDAATMDMLADFFDTSTDYLIGRVDAQHTENALVVDQLGLSDRGIKSIKELKEMPIHSMSKEGAELPFDGRTGVDVLNDMAETDLFRSFIFSVGLLTDTTIDQWENFKYIDDPYGEGYSAKSAYKSMVHDRLDSIIAEISDKWK